MNRLFLFIALYVFSVAVTASEIPAYYKNVAAAYKIPSALLYAVATQESKPPLNSIQSPWPWTINCNRKSHYFETKQEAVDMAKSNIEKGQLCDLSIMQVNWYWHNHRFTSIEQAFDPYININIGAEILSEWYADSGSWEIAVGKYHSPSNPIKAAKYRENVRRKLAQIKGIKF